MDKDLPQGWCYARLSDLGELARGKSKHRPRNDPKLYGNVMPFIQTGEVARSGGLIRSFSKMYSEFGVQQSRVFPKGTICITIAANIADTGILDFDACFPDSVVGLITDDALADSHFVEFFLQTAREDIAQFAPATAQANINLEILNKVVVPLPPLNEQRRIVAKIEALKARSQQVKEELEAIPALLDQFRQSVLAAAFRGDLTADWREKNPDVEPASVLLDRIRAERRRCWEEAELEKMKAQGKTPKDDKWKEKYKEFSPVNNNNPSVFEKSVIPTQWSWVTLGDVAECLDKMRVPINKDEREKRIGDIPYYGANGQVGWIDDYIFDEALVIVVEDETFIGRTKPFCYKISGKSWVNNHAHVLRATDAVKIDYLNYSLMFYPFIPLTSGSTGRRKLTQAALMSAPYLLAPLGEQQEIVRRVELFFKTAEQIEQQYKEAKAYLDQLNQSILAKAFRGELVPQDPNDEPASVLLERIRAEREKLDTKKKAKGKTEKKSRKAKPEASEPEQLSLPGFE